ncbi:hypothetical protein GPJ56_009795 [Histomonas meleagridis]|uniref:uncharacterized protein n=1 Tax=Histomonas meleagridis TaxID=135588 RepID=UPI00355A00B5|nr:hypothetical protein GPJ56_009795 [Histomonas meleagridis]KAH0802899.1 hypothetical protein GO595_004406 [Histomonas meleagridis]
MAPQWPKIIAILGCNVYNFQFHSISVRTTKSFEFTASPTHEILDLKYEPIEQISTVSSMFPVSQNFSTYSEYREKAISWYEKTQRAARKLALPLPVWSTVNYPFKPFINPKLKYRIPTGYLGPENHLQLEAIIINKEPFDESSVFGEKGRFQKDVPIKDHISLGKSTLIPPEPDPEYYDDYESYLQAVNNWTQICSNCTLIPHHPSEFKEKDCPELEPNPNSGHSLPPEFQYDYDSIYQPDLESTCSRQKFIRGPSSGKLKLKKTKVKNRSKTFKVKTKIVKKKVKIAKPKTFSKKMVKVISKLFKALQRADYNQQTPIAPHKMTFPYISFPFYPGNLLSTMQSHGNDSLDTKSYSILRVFKLVAYSFNAASQYGFISNFEFKTFPSFNEIIHALNYAYSSSSSFYSLYMFYFLFHVFDTNPTISKMLISNTSSMYVTLRILIRFSHVSDCIYDPMVGKFNELSKEENDPMYELFYQSLTGVYTTKV